MLWLTLALLFGNVCDTPLRAQALRTADREILQRILPDSGIFYYTDRIPEGVITEMRRMLRERKIYRLPIRDSGSVISLSSAEKQHLLNEMQKCTLPFLAAGEIARGIGITFDTLWTPETLGTLERRHMSAYVLSRPVYLRNERFAAIYMMRVCASMCGNSGLGFYQKDGNIWKRYGALYTGEF